MVRFVRTVVSLFVVGVTVTAIVSAIAALALKRRAVSVGAADDDEIALVSIFEPLVFSSQATSFQGGSVDCLFGGGVVDLRGATLDPAGATLHLRAIFGGAQVIVPETWQVTTHLKGIFGGAGDARPHIERPVDAPHLTIDGLALFGGAGITSEASEGQQDWMRRMRERQAAEARA